jgi:hypothetical protein
MKSRLPALLFVSLFVFLAILGIYKGAQNAARYNAIAEQDQADIKYLNERIGAFKDGSPITRKHLIDMLILKALKEAQLQVESNGR